MQCLFFGSMLTRAVARNRSRNFLTGSTGPFFRPSEYLYATATGIASRQRIEQQKATLYTKLVEELKACGIEQNDIVVSIVENSDADWSFGNGRAQFLTGEL
jgi:hypothetical protein